MTDLAEALVIVRSEEEPIVPVERRHLLALQEYHECELIRLVHELETVMKAALKRN